MALLNFIHVCSKHTLNLFLVLTTTREFVKWIGSVILAYMPYDSKRVSSWDSLHEGLGCMLCEGIND